MTSHFSSSPVKLEIFTTPQYFTQNTFARIRARLFRDRCPQNRRLWLSPGPVTVGKPEVGYFCNGFGTPFSSAVCVKRPKLFFGLSLFYPSPGYDSLPSSRLGCKVQPGPPKPQKLKRWTPLSSLHLTANTRFATRRRPNSACMSPASKMISGFAGLCVHYFGSWNGHTSPSKAARHLTKPMATFGCIIENHVAFSTQLRALFKSCGCRLKPG